MSDKEAIDRLFNMFAEDDESAARMWGFKEKPPVETKSEGGNDNNTELETLPMLYLIGRVRGQSGR